MRLQLGINPAASPEFEPMDNWVGRPEPDSRTTFDRGTENPNDPRNQQMRQDYANDKFEQQSSDIAGAFANDEAQAAQVANLYRQAGFTNVADNYRQSFKRNAFNMARRGLGGGSADTDTQVRNQADAGGQARQVELQANQQYAQRMQQSMQERAGMQTQLAQNPYTAAVEGSAVDAITAQTRRLMGVYDTTLAGRANEQAANAAQAQVLSNTIGGIGGSIGWGIEYGGGKATPATPTTAAGFGYTPQTTNSAITNRGG